MTGQGHLHDRSVTPHRTYFDGGRVADWSNAFIVASVLSAIVIIAAIVIAVYDNSILLASYRGSIASEPAQIAQDGGGSVETDGRAR